MSIHLKWSGPFSFYASQNAHSIFDEKIADAPGIYMWTISYHDAYLVNYVGIANSSISKRQQEHLEMYMCGKYLFYDPSEFIKGNKILVYRPEDTFKTFLERYVELSQLMIEQTKLFSIFVAPIKDNKVILERIESSLIESFRQAGGTASSFIDNVRISRYVPNEERIPVTYESSVKFIGLPAIINA